MVIGVLALQGAFLEHEKMLEKLNVDFIEIRKKEDLKTHIDGLILPGGESTTIGKLLKDLDIYEDLKLMIQQGLPTFGTCAGMILLAKKLYNDDTVHLGLMDIEVKRNAYGRQLGSFVVNQDFQNMGVIPMVFIRAPYIQSVKENVEVLCVVNDNIVGARQDNMLVTSFHPELTSSTKVHEYFINMIKEKNGIKC